MFHYCIPPNRQPTSPAIHEKLGGTGIIDEPVFKTQRDTLADLLSTNDTVAGGGI